MSQKIEHTINLNIPIDVWDDVEDLLLVLKRKREDRKLLKKDLLVELIKRGVDATRGDR